MIEIKDVIKLLRCSRGYVGWYSSTSEDWDKLQCMRYPANGNDQALPDKMSSLLSQAPFDGQHPQFWLLFRGGENAERLYVDEGFVQVRGGL